MINPVLIHAPAKLNLCLHITGKRDDGYHLLESLVAFTEFGDRLEIKAADTLGITVKGPFAVALQNESDNLILRAAKLLQAHTGYTGGAHITLHKYIPVGGGLGGGSADAAATLKGLNSLWRLNLDANKLAELGLQLGSDVPSCLLSQAAWLRGVGEDITPVNLETDGIAVLLANPNTPLLTADVYRGFSESVSPPSSLPNRIGSLDALVAWLKPTHNALQRPACGLLPVIAAINEAIAAMPGCKLARMTGSGATCFGLFSSQQKADAAARRLRKNSPEWWTIATGLYGKAE